MMTTEAKREALIEFARFAARPDGAWSRDRERYLHNVIDHIIERAESVLTLIGADPEGGTEERDTYEGETP